MTLRLFNLVVVAAALHGLAAGRAPAQVMVNGWTVFNPSPDTRTVYISSSRGDDQNPGTIGAPVKTLGAGYALLRDGYPDWLLLRCGDVWYETFPDWNKGGRSSTEPMRVGSYGQGERPHIMSGINYGLPAPNFTVPRAHVAITDLWLTADRNTGYGDCGGIVFLGKWSDVLIENCRSERYTMNVIAQGSPGEMSNIRVRRSVICDSMSLTESHTQGLLAAGVAGLLIEECVVDRNGAGPDGAPNTVLIFGCNMYLQYDCSNVVTRGNIVARAAAMGIMQRPGGLTQGNLCLANPMNINIGYVDAEPIASCTVRDNVILDSRDIQAADPRGHGIHLERTANVEAMSNILAWRTAPASWNLFAISMDDVTQGADVHDNIVWKWWEPGAQNPSGLRVDGRPVAPIALRNNSVQMQTGGAVVVNSVGVPLTLARNKYFSPVSQPFGTPTGSVNFPQWQSVYGDLSTFSAAAYPDPDRSIATYMASLSLEPTLEAFLARARLQSRTNWSEQFTARAVANYIRAGFGVPPVPTGPCPADLNGDGVLNLNDMIAFQKFLFREDLRADVNHDGVLNTLDVSAFTQMYNSGCP